MRTSSVSSSSISQAMRYALMRSQGELVKAQKEMATLKHADVGLALGTRNAQSINFQRDMDRLSTILDSNALAKARLSATQHSLTNISDAATAFLSTLTSSISGAVSGTIVQDAAKTVLTTMTSLLNASVNGERIFAGTNTDVTPISSFEAGSAAKTSFDAAFQTHFGFSQNDPAAANISAADMNAFITDALEPQFLGAGWQANWSSATDQPIVSRIALNETASTSVSANDNAVRRLTMAAASIGDLLGSNLSTAGKQALIERSASRVGDAITGLADLQARTGFLEKRITDASSRIEKQVNLFEKHLVDLEGVDPTTAATRVSDLLQHVETSLALTARVKQLTLLNYLT